MTRRVDRDIAGHPTITGAPRLIDWLAHRLGDEGPFELTPLRGGNSNTTYRLRSPTASRIIRCPPQVAVSDGAHRMDREWQLLTALVNTPVPCPVPVVLCDDPAVVAQPVLVMQESPGFAIEDVLPPEISARPGLMNEVGVALIEALATLHEVDWQAHGLSTYGRPDGFLQRQVPRWTRHFLGVQVRELPLFERLADWLTNNVPAGVDPTIIHCDYHLDNCLVSAGVPVRVNAILDWELSTIGDPLLDLGLLLALWGDDRPASPALRTIQGVTRGRQAPSRSELAGLYARRTGRDVSDLPYYMTLACWKLAAIVEGSYAAFVRGDYDSEYSAELRADVPRLLEEAWAHAHT